MKHPNITCMELTDTYIRCPSCHTAMIPFQIRDEYDPNDHKQIIGNIELTCNTARHIALSQYPKCFKIWQTVATDEIWSRKEK